MEVSKQTNNINEAAVVVALYSTRKGKMSNVYLPVCWRLKQVCKTYIVTKFRAWITYKVDKTELLFDHLLLLPIIFDPDLLPLVLLVTSSSSHLFSAVLNVPWPACEMCVCVRACLFPSLVSSTIASTVPNLFLRSQLKKCKSHLQLRRHKSGPAEKEEEEEAQERVKQQGRTTRSKCEHSSPNYLFLWRQAITLANPLSGHRWLSSGRMRGRMMGQMTIDDETDGWKGRPPQADKTKDII